MDFLVCEETYDLDQTEIVAVIPHTSIISEESNMLCGLEISYIIYDEETQELIQDSDYLFYPDESCE